MSKTQLFASALGNVAFTDNNGVGLPVIFMHGLPTSKELWSPVLADLPAEWRLITFDLLDYGESEKIARPTNHKERADTLDELRAHLGLEKFVLVAHDLGSSVAIDYMGKYAAHVEKLVLISPPVYPDFVEPFIVKLVRLPGLGEALVTIIKPLLFRVGMAQGMVHKDNLTPEVLKAISGGFKGADGNAALLRVLRWGRPISMFADYPTIIASICAPTLVIQGRCDPYIPENQVTRLRDTIPGCKLVFIEDGAHFLPLDTPQVAAREINDFLSG
ncbi:MAG: alpha/beta hydrolase [Candidatus Latescibacteria bacterium]|nr:alpha/beta hydrolase [Candidatus Latescibacterota bacterium]